MTHHPPRSGAWAWLLVLAAALPLALLLLDVAVVLGGALDAASEDLYSDMGLPEPAPTTSLQRASTALSGVAVGSTLLVATVAVVVLAVAVVAGGGRWVPARGSRAAGAVVAGVTALTGLAAAAASVAGLSWTSGYPFTPSWAVQQAPLVAPMVFVVVFAATACAALLRPARW